MKNLIRARSAEFFLILLVTLLCLRPGCSLLAAPGQTGVSFLTLGVGARAAAMANAHVAVATDATALYWNPAGLAEVKTREIAVSHSEWFQGIRYEFAGLAFDVGKSAVALGFQWLYSVDKIDGRDENGNPNGDFGYYDLTYSLSLARKFEGGLSLGLTYKRITEMIDDNHANGEALDAGLRIPTPLRGVVLAGGVQNIGRNMHFKREDFELPRTVVGGIGLERNLPGGTLVLASDLRAPRGEDYKIHAGGEFTLHRGLSLAAGYKIGYENENISFGMGYAAGPLKINYSFTPFYSDLGNVQRISLYRSF
ncbi:MAG: PorV/PorQ family protein [Candidatus Eisenbacteria bacterium]|nr:PorV/PorQ family protein [Candidatus Eisenbacteria bacterium]